MFIPATPEELRNLGWKRLDVILVSGDSYVDSPYVGVSLIGQRLMKEGYRVGIIAQPDLKTEKDISRFGEPLLFWGVTGGCIDSLVANRTASGKRRRGDDFTAGGINNRRPDRAVMAYTNLIRRHFKRTVPIVIGGIEASLRRMAHYDFWSSRVRRSILIDAKADFLLYGMADRSVTEFAARIRESGDVKDIRGLCYAAVEPVPGYEELPSWEETAADPTVFERMFLSFCRNQDFRTARGLCQRHDSRWLIQNPPQPPLTEAEMDDVHGMAFERAAHPSHRRQGRIRALETIRFSIPTHRGCYGGCNFCAIAVHEGRQVSSRSEGSILREAELLVTLPGFQGRIHDVGGPTANMYGFECARKLRSGACLNRNCLFPEVCNNLRPDHRRQIALLRNLRKIPGIRQSIVASGIRHDLVFADMKHGQAYLREVVRHHVSGQMKVAPEHSDENVLRLMGKPGIESMLAFRRLFGKLTSEAGKEQYLAYYLIAAHPGCSDSEMEGLRSLAVRQLAIQPEQVQIFTPTPSTISTLMYHAGRDAVTGKSIYVERTAGGRERQKKILVAKKGRFGYGNGAVKSIKGEEKSWAKTRTLKKTPRKNLPKR